MLDLDVHKSLGSFSLNVRAETQARVLGLVGPSGCGKTTLLNCIAGVVEPDSGHVNVGGEVVFRSNPPRMRTPVHRRRIGYVFQDGRLFPHMSVERNIRYGLRAGPTGPSFDEVVSVLGLGELLSRDIRTLSGGESRRVALARALVSQPRLLLLDEPLTGLDRNLAGRTLAFIRRALNVFQIPAVVVSHSINEVLFLCEEAWCMCDGRVVAAGRPDTVLVTHSLHSDFARQELANVFIAGIRSTEPEQFTTFRMGETELHAACDIQPGSTEALLSIPASDVLIAVDRPGRISARNILPAKILRVDRAGNHTVLTVDVGIRWFVLLTGRAVEELGLHPGLEVYAIVKANSISVESFP